MENEMLERAKAAHHEYMHNSESSKLIAVRMAEFAASEVARREKEIYKSIRSITRQHVNGQFASWLLAVDDWFEREFKAKAGREE